MLSPPRRTALLGLALLACSCNVIGWRQRRYEEAFVGAGLRLQQLSLGPDRVRFWEGGQGPAIVLVHGFGADALWQWHAQVESLARGHRLIIPDLLWFGGSESTSRDFSIAHQVRMLLALAGHLGVERASWVGISYGGFVVYELASQHPRAVQRLVLVDSPGEAFNAEDYRALCRRFSVSHIGSLLVPADAAGVRRLMAVAYEKPPWTPDFAARQALSLLTPFRAEKLALLDAALRELEVRRSAVSRPQAPTLLLWGREDPIFPLYLGERLQRILGRTSRLVVIDRSRHAPNLERPDELNRILVPWLRGG